MKLYKTPACLETINNHLLHLTMNVGYMQKILATKQNIECRDRKSEMNVYFICFTLFILIVGLIKMNKSYLVYFSFDVHSL